MSRTYILDTNVLLHDPKSLFVFEEHSVIIPIWVLEEIDRFKTDMNERGFNARTTGRYLDKLRERGSLKEGVKLQGGGTLRVAWDGYLDAASPPSVDNAIVKLAKELADAADEGDEVILVSRDTNMRVKADAVGVKAENYRHDAVADADRQYTGAVELDVLSQDIDDFYEGFPLEFDLPTLFPHQFVHLKAGSQSALARWDGSRLVRLTNQEVWKVRPRNKEQAFALDLLVNPDVQLVTLMGVAGTGKTLVALAAGLAQVCDASLYRKLLVSRPVIPMGKDIGFLPGPQPLDAKILTPTGWVEMGSLHVGSEVIGRDGKPTRVLGVFPKGEKEVFRVRTSDGASTECCADHLWFTQTAEQFKRKKPGAVRNTQEIAATLAHPTKPNRFNHYLPQMEAAEFHPTDLPLPPYTLGALLGDGCFSGSVCLVNKDAEILARVSSEVAPSGCFLHKSDKIAYTISRSGETRTRGNKPGRVVCVTNLDTGEQCRYDTIGSAVEFSGLKRGVLHYRCTHESVVGGRRYSFESPLAHSTNPIRNALHLIGLVDTWALTKFIPDMYLYSASAPQRLDLLRGLMDTDGCVKRNGEATYTTISEKLAQGVVDLVRGLGGRATFRVRDRVGKTNAFGAREITARHLSYVVSVAMPEHLNPFHVSRKAERHRCKYTHGRVITSVEHVGVKPVQCILVENPEHLYVTDGFIVTHNTMEEKLSPWMQPIFDNLDVLVTGNGKVRGTKDKNYQYLLDSGTLQVEALTYIRGRSIPQQYLIIDEAQNLTPHEVKTIITRAGEGTKIVLTGDPAQIDNPYVDAKSNGLTYAVERFKDSYLAGHVTLLKGERSALAEEATKRL